MKKLVRVTIEKDIEIEIADEALTDAQIVEFSRYMWHVDGARDLFCYAARQIAEYGNHFV